MPSDADRQPVRAPGYREAQCCEWCAHGAMVMTRGAMRCDRYGLVLPTSCCDDWKADVDADGEADDD